MIDVYKIGKEWYKTGDKNSGLFEYSIVQEELADIKTANRTLVIINGKFYDDAEKRYLSTILSFYDTKIFIASDIIALDENRDIIEQCQYLLHQCPNNDVISNLAIKQYYSWVPELFYKYNRSSTDTNKQEKVIFGGGVRDNGVKLEQYLSAVPSTAYLKTEDSDNRIGYFGYLLELSNCMFSFVVARTRYNELGWVTARYCEALAKNTLPICDSAYDSTNHFNAIKVSSPEELREIFDELTCTEYKRLKLLYDAKHKMSINMDNFKRLILTITGGHV